jgi:hypothetical protein
MENQKKVFRFKFSDEMLNLMKEFSKIHQFDKKEIFDEHWDRFLKNNKEVIDNEETRLIHLGYKGAINDKIYKSIKYYYNKKDNNKDEQIKEKPKRKKYVSVGVDVLEDMHKHIEDNINNENYKPDTGFNEFIENLNLTDKDQLQRYKKAYKNMYYRIKL